MKCSYHPIFRCYGSPQFIPIGGSYDTAKEALNYCYNLAGRMRDVLDWQVVENPTGLVIFHRYRSTGNVPTPENNLQHQPLSSLSVV
jgi:hypothetical protein